MHLPDLFARPDLWLLLSAIPAALAARNAVRSFKPNVAAGAGFFFAGWITTELALQHVAIQVVWVALWVDHGALRGWPGWVGLAMFAAGWVSLVRLHQRGHLAVLATKSAFHTVGLPHHPLVRGRLPLLHVVNPFWHRHRKVRRLRNRPIFQGDGYTLHADVFHRRDLPPGAPVLVYVHGGGWVIGYKKHQGLPLLTRMAAAGWVCMSVDYRLSPRATFPDHLIDVKRGIAWAREHAHEWGGDPRFLAICGNSAGAHLSSLAALTPGQAALQPGFEAADTHVDALVGLYGVYDLTNRFGHWPGDGIKPLWEKLVAKKTREEAPALYRAASPIDQVNRRAPPTLLIHGTNDTLAPTEESRRFAHALRAVSDQPVLLAEIDGAQHAFEIFHSVRGRYAVDAIAHFLNLMRDRAERARDWGGST